jgi:penicillin-binding protein 1A
MRHVGKELGFRGVGTFGGFLGFKQGALMAHCLRNVLHDAVKARDISFIVEFTASLATHMANISARRDHTEIYFMIILFNNGTLERLNHAPNIAAVKLAQQVGIPAVAKQVRKLGITGGVSIYPAMALGTTPIPLIDMTRAFAAVASGKYPVRATGLWRTDPWPETVTPPEATAASWPVRTDMLQLLQSAVRNGTGNAARLSMPTWGKTGTTQNHRDALFIGFAGDLVVGIWVGNDDNSPMAASLVGGGLPARLWKGFMTAALQSEGRLEREAEVAPVEVDMEALALDMEGMTLNLDGTPSEPPPADTTDADAPPEPPQVPAPPPPQ